jgi:hypothetical protein
MPSKLIVEFALLVLCGLIALGRRIPGDAVLRKVEGAARAFASREFLLCIAAAVLVLTVRAALLPVWPIPKPSIYDEFSYLLQADTFAHGRLTNPSHPMWQFFETVYVLQQPTYTSKYPPGQALVMAVGQLLLGNPWFGVWLSCGGLAAALCWALQGWVRPGWALLGTLVSLDLCIFGYWMNSYWGGAVAGIGGALVVGAYARRGKSASAGWIFGLGCVILLLTRPYEGFLLAAPVTIALWLDRNARRMRVWLPIFATLAAGFVWTAFYDYRVTGHVLRMPYQEYFAQYESVPPLTIVPVQHTKPERHFDLEFLDSGWARDTNRIARSWRLLPARASDLYLTAATIFGDPMWLLLLAAFSLAWRRARRIRLLVVCVGILLAGAMIELIFYAHYAAPFTAVLLILLVTSLRDLRVWARRRLPAGSAAARFAVGAVCATLLGVGLAAECVRIYQHRTPDRIQAKNARKRGIEQNLVAEHPGRHVIFVRYTGIHSPHEEWIYNLSDIDAQPVIWAQDMGAENSRLIDYYPGRTFWMFLPDDDAGSLLPYRPLQ